mmetsp:Transcript_45127/g.107313  ORF Transcript_45127/g.107313 Transcript_45127/m.107313 type:complete len:119 (+) Transcript_45127:158-514(+)
MAEGGTKKKTVYSFFDEGHSSDVKEFLASQSVGRRRRSSSMEDTLLQFLEEKNYIQGDDDSGGSKESVSAVSQQPPEPAVMAAEPEPKKEVPKIGSGDPVIHKNLLQWDLVWRATKNF